MAIREYVPLEKFEDGINGMPVTNEWRCFFWGTTLVSSGYYWAQAECAEDMGSLPEDARALACEAALTLVKKVPSFVVDVAKTEEGKWIVVEINSFQMSGLSMIDPETFYTRLLLAVCKE